MLELIIFLLNRMSYFFTIAEMHFSTADSFANMCVLALFCKLTKDRNCSYVRTSYAVS